MLAKTPLRDLAVAWLEQQDPNESYEWSDCSRCACAQLSKALGRFEEWMLSLGSLRGAAEWDRLNMIAHGPTYTKGESDWTYGAFLDRLRAEP